MAEAHRQTIRITSVSNGALVTTDQAISGTGFDQNLKNYLVVVDATGNRFNQGPITSTTWTLNAHFGAASTPSGARFSVSVISSPEPLPLGELRALPPGTIESAVVRVIRK
jgi:hypothetical protein